MATLTSFNINELTLKAKKIIKYFLIRISHTATKFNNKLSLLGRLPPIKKLDMDFIDLVYHNEMKHKKSIINKVLQYNSSSVDFLAKEERAFPGNQEFLQSGYFEVMLKRYLFAGYYLCRNNNVLDTCSGLGWGTYIISHYAKKITAFDLDISAINFCKSEWGKTDKINWIVDNALSMESINDNWFDVGLAMETIEHFSREDGEKYIQQISRKLKINGVLIGTSSFPDTESDAEKICKNNPFHLHIFTKKELGEILNKYFKEYTLINDWMFIARK